jgi:hypothetical protein
MLPGFRILFAAVVLSFSVLIFGLGAAALLRSAHEEFVGIPAWRAAQQPLMPAVDASRPSLALLRVEPPKAERVETAKPDGVKTVSIDTQATDKTVTTEKPAIENVSKPRVRRAKRARNVRLGRNAKTIRHWSSRTQQIVQPQQPLASSNSPFIGFDAADTTASSGAGRNRRTAANSPF